MTGKLFLLSSISICLYMLKSFAPPPPPGTCLPQVACKTPTCDWQIMAMTKDLVSFCHRQFPQTSMRDYKSATCRCCIIIDEYAFNTRIFFPPPPPPPKVFFLNTPG